MIGGLSPQKGFVRNRKARCMCKRDENRVIRTDVRGDETYREKCLLSDPIADDSLGRGHAGGRPDEAFKGCGASEDMLIIEDDYNSEFRYYNRPTPSLQGLSGGRGVVYLGTFSRLLLPSIRMSYMVLPPDLLKRYQERGRFYNQTASKAEQIALCQFIRDGHLESQIRKSKKLYAAKAKCLCDAVRRIFGEKARTHLGDAGFLVLMELESPLTSAEIAGRAAQAGVAVRPVESVGSLLEKQEHHFQEGYPKLLLSCASMGAERYEEALEVLKGVVYKKEK